MPTSLHHHLGCRPVDILLEPYTKLVSFPEHDALFLVGIAYPPKTFYVVVVLEKKELRVEM